MKKYIFLLTCLLSTSFVMAQCPYAGRQAKESCPKKATCDKSYKCDKKTKLLDGDKSYVDKKWRIGAVGLNIGGFGDHYQNMTVEGMKSMAIDMPTSANSVSVAGLNLLDDANSVSISGSTIGAYISLNPRNKSKDGFKMNQELRIGLNANIEREAMIQYSDFDYDNSVIYCLIENELVLSAQYLFSGKFGRRLGFYGGGGMSVGGTFDNIFLLIEDSRDNNGSWESNTTTVEAKSSYYTRGFLSAGLMYHTLGRVSLSFDMQTGIGMQLVNGAKNNFISDSCVGQVGVQYRFLK